MRAIVLFAHGSRDPQWHLPMLAVKARITEADPNALVACAYLELSVPDLPTAVADCIASGAREICVVPLFLGVGKHVRHDLPAMMETLGQQHANIRFECKPPVGEHPALLNLLAQIACE